LIFFSLFGIFYRVVICTPWFIMAFNILFWIIISSPGIGTKSKVKQQQEGIFFGVYDL